MGGSDSRATGGGGGTGTSYSGGTGGGWGYCSGARNKHAIGEDGTNNGGSGGRCFGGYSDHDDYFVGGARQPYYRYSEDYY